MINKLISFSALYEPYNPLSTDAIICLTTYHSKGIIELGGMRLCKNATYLAAPNQSFIFFTAASKNGKSKIILQNVTG